MCVYVQCGIVKLDIYQTIIIYVCSIPFTRLPTNSDVSWRRTKLQNFLINFRGVNVSEFRFSEF